MYMHTHIHAYTYIYKHAYNRFWHTFTYIVVSMYLLHVVSTYIPTNMLIIYLCIHIYTCVCLVVVVVFHKAPAMFVFLFFSYKMRGESSRRAFHFSTSQSESGVDPLTLISKPKIAQAQNLFVAKQGTSRCVCVCVCLRESVFAYMWVSYAPKLPPRHGKLDVRAR